MFPMAPMGVLAPGSVHAWPSAWPPINTSDKLMEHTIKVFKTAVLSTGAFIMLTFCCLSV